MYVATPLHLCCTGCVSLYMNCRGHQLEINPLDYGLKYLCAAGYKAERCGETLRERCMVHRGGG